MLADPRERGTGLQAFGGSGIAAEQLAGIQQDSLASGEGRMADAEEELRIAREAFMRLGAAIYLKQVEQVVGTVSM